ncbi:beta clamp domain-containing protein [Oceanibaculum indicum]|uniref:Beta sliding clamp n=1 Tax=Oceanibaculum indicum TaxID=526216 RepID=A0A420WGN2_9PROT|nr:hypothetical protein [Oceanibaculum indicum]RKQ70143.1 DNA polymerase III sliding clamp (beta) subunit (PCNA family) [Oceanibaculum indicum]
MKIEIEAARLARALSSARAVMKDNKVIEIYGHALLIAEGETLRLKTSNMDMTAEMTLPAHVLVPGRCTMPADRLSHALSCAREGAEVRIELADRDRVIVRSGRNRHEMMSMDPDLLGGLPDIENPICDFVAPVHEWLAWAAPAAHTKPELRPEMAGVWMSVDYGRMVIAACDSHHGLIRREDIPLGADALPDTMITSDVVAVICKLFDAPARILLNRNRIDVSGEGVRLSAKLGDVRRPPFERAMERKNFDSFTVPRADLQAAIKAVLPLTAAKNSMSVEVLVADDQMRIACRSDAGEIAVSDTDIEQCPPAPLRFSFNPRHLLSLLAAASVPIVRISISKDDQVANVLATSPVDGWPHYAAGALNRNDPHIDLAKLLTPEGLISSDVQEAA